MGAVLYGVFQKTTIWSFFGENCPKNFFSKIIHPVYFYAKNRLCASKPLKNASQIMKYTIFVFSVLFDRNSWKYENWIFHVLGGTFSGTIGKNRRLFFLVIIFCKFRIKYRLGGSSTWSKIELFQHLNFLYENDPIGVFSCGEHESERILAFWQNA